MTASIPQLQIILYEPEIPPNTGAIMRLCANSGMALHLIEPLGFSLDDKQLRRAGMDYREIATMQRYPDLSNCLQSISPNRVLAMTTKGKNSVYQFEFQHNDAVLFGPETRGLPDHLLQTYLCLRIPMQPQSRSLNLANAVAITAYEAWRQWDFAGSDSITPT